MADLDHPRLKNDKWNNKQVKFMNYKYQKSYNL